MDEEYKVWDRIVVPMAQDAGVDPFNLLWGFWAAVGLGIYVWLAMHKRCPKCGAWFGERPHGADGPAGIVYKCKRCGAERTLRRRFH